MEKIKKALMKAGISSQLANEILAECSCEYIQKCLKVGIFVHYYESGGVNYGDEYTL